ncbi:MAG: BatD family protein [Puniceicoccaceae bacterium]
MTLVSPALWSQSVLVQAEAKPSVVMVGQAATYSIRFLNTDSIPNLNTPRVAGLDFNSTPSTSSYQQMINGRVSVETELSWTFRPTETGTYTIPGRIIQIRGEEIAIPDVQVRCIPMDEETKSRALLRLEIQQPPYFVGQALPARLALLVRRDLNLANVAFPESEGDAFLHSEFDNNPIRGTINYNGQSYNALVWDILITPIKSGTAELRFRQNIALQIVSPDSRFPSVFSMSRTRTETTTLATDAISTDILPLPEDNRPDGFTGGIGELAIASSVSSTELTVGEPMTLTLTVSGEGNFDRISPPELAGWENWRIYPPKVEFTPEDDRGFAGSKSYEFILIPQSEDITEIPAIEYATFDPRATAYSTDLLEAVPVTVAPSLKPVDSAPFIPGLSSEEEDQEERIPENILPLQADPGNLHPYGSILWKETSFWLMNLGIGLVLGLLAGWSRQRRRLLTDSSLARRHRGSRKVRKALQQAQVASRKGSVAEFLEVARFALQESISHLASEPLEAKTLVTTDCMAILRSSNVDASIQTKVTTILDKADAHQFAGVPIPPEELESLQRDLASVVQELSRHKR